MRSRRDRTDSSAAPGASYRPPELAAGAQSATGTELAVAAHPDWAAPPARPGRNGAGPEISAGPGAPGHRGPAGRAGHGPGRAGPGGTGPGSGPGSGPGGPGGGPLAVGAAPRAAFRSPLKNWRVRS